MSTLFKPPLDASDRETARVGERFAFDDGWVEVFSTARLPTSSGEFEIVVYTSNLDDKEHLALVRGQVRGQADVPVRVHSECLTGDVLGSLRCDCREQLQHALTMLGRAECGVLVYLRQEGRGIGLGNKIRAYALQETGLDTFAANRHLGFDDDLRDYTVAALILRSLGVVSVRLATNNPRKIFGLRKAGVSVSSRLPITIAANAHNADYLDAKARSGHLIPPGGH